MIGKQHVISATRPAIGDGKAMTVSKVQEELASLMPADPFVSRVRPSLAHSVGPACRGVPSALSRERACDLRYLAAVGRYSGLKGVPATRDKRLNLPDSVSSP